jgi:hypothetical protein
LRWRRDTVPQRRHPYARCRCKESSRWFCCRTEDTQCKRTSLIS